MGQDGCKSGGCEQAVFCSKPDKKCDQRNEKNGMHELPVAQEVKELVSCPVAYAAAENSKKDVWDEIKIREN
ncbi:hypothetical protein SDC9_190092 [bioreactor metagenome]|uniref:Uncharacterized protein n=1 Tax=bioreactor metagenome TaxID=1076179 RepID=A0A645HU04_9ZZZZ